MKHTKFAFTLIELLVVIAIISILAAILAPVFAQARESARTSVCTSNVRQIGLAISMYVQDYDQTFPIFYAYNTQTPDGLSARAGEPLHKGTELLLQPYIKSQPIFKCPNDFGSPFITDTVYGCPGLSSYIACYGSSYRFNHGSFSTISNESSQNNSVYLNTSIVSDASFDRVSDTRIMRDEMMPWFGKDSKYGYIDGYFKSWHPWGGGTVFADGHSKFTTTSGSFDQQIVCPDGGKSGDIDPNSPGNGNLYGTYYGLCD